MDPSRLHVISVISNPIRYESRTRLFREFLERQKAAGVTQWVVEATFGERAPSIVDPDDPHHIRVRCDHEIWIKENLINIGAQRLPADARYVAWVDGDITFERSDWAAETLEYLQHYDVVQPFSQAVDLGPQGEVLSVHNGFAYCHRQGDRLGPNNVPGGHVYGGPYWHSGYAWAWRMDAWNTVGGMIDRAILGAGDHHMACALIGKVEISVPGNIHPHYRAMCDAWQARASSWINGNIGYLPGSIRHHYHGRKEDRKYQSRWDVLTAAQFDPFRDIAHDRHGVLQWTTDKRGLIDGCRQYFRDRREDPI